MNTEIIREALTEAKEAMMWELGGEPIWSLTAASRLKIEEALTALDDVKVPCIDLTKEGNWLDTELVYVHLESGEEGYADAKDIRSLRYAREAFAELKADRDHLEKCFLAEHPPVTAPCLDSEEATLLMELMQAALKGEKLALFGRLSEQQLYNKLAVLAGNKEQQ